MAATLLSQVNPLSSFSYTESQENGKQIVFTELWHSDAIPLYDRVQEILDATDWQLGATIDDGAFVGTQVVSRHVTMASDSDKNVFQLQATFGPVTRLNGTGKWLVNYSATTSQAQTNVDVNNNFITVGTIVGNPATPAVPTTTEVPKTGAIVDKLFPSGTITASAKLDWNPFTYYSGYVGKLNDGDFNFPESGPVFASKTLMLTSINVASNDNDTTFNVDYTFEYRADPLDWYAVVVAIDPKTGKPYEGIGGTVYKGAGPTGADVTKGTPGITSGSLGYKIYGEADFDELITWSF